MLCLAVWPGQFHSDEFWVFQCIIFLIENLREVIFLIYCWRRNSVDVIVACDLISLSHFEVVNVTGRSDTLREANKITSV